MVGMHMLAMHQVVAQHKEAVGHSLLHHGLQLLHACPTIHARHSPGRRLPEHHQHSLSEELPQYMLLCPARQKQSL